MTKNRLFFAEVTITNKRRLSLATSSCSFQCPGIWHPLLSTDLPVAISLGTDPHSLQRDKTQKQSHEIAARGGIERPCRHRQLSPHSSPHTTNQLLLGQELDGEPHP